MSLTVLKRPEPWDVVVIGSGATGGWAAHCLGARGLSVLVLEAGSDGADAALDAPELSLRGKRAVDRITGRRQVQATCPAYWELDPELFVRDDEHPYEVADGAFHWIRTRAVNGRLLTWGGIGVRVSDYELRAPEQDGFGEPWPFRAADLDAHYDRIDAFLPVYGTKEGLPQLPDGNYVGAPRLTAAEESFRRHVEERFPGRRVIPSRGVLARPSSRRGAETPPPSPIREAVRRYKVRLRANAVVSHIVVGDDGQARAVAFVDRLTKRVHEVPTRSVALCASTLETTRILLNSSSRHHPAGLGNSSGTLGRYLMDHPAVYLSGFAPGERDVPWLDGTGGPKNIMIPRFQNLQNRAGGAFLRGYGIFGGIGRHGAERRFREKPECDADEVPFTLVAYGEMLPRFENRATRSARRVDEWGIPVLEIACKLSDNEHAMRAHMVESLTEMVHAAGGRISGAPHYFEPGGFVHEMGTARMGKSPADSVVSPFGQCWDAPNVFVMDGAAWPSGAWQNPTFTMMAFAGRASEHLALELEQGRLSAGRYPASGARATQGDPETKVGS